MVNFIPLQALMILYNVVNNFFYSGLEYNFKEYQNFQ